MLPLFAKSLHTVGKTELLESGATLPWYCLSWARVLPEGLRRNGKGFLRWKSRRLFIDINSTLEMLAMMLREAVGREGNLILPGVGSDSLSAPRWRRPPPRFSLHNGILAELFALGIVILSCLFYYLESCSPPTASPSCTVC